MGMGLLGALGGAAEYELSDINDQKKRERDLNDYKARADFANTLQTQLMEKKLQLAQQYPQYSHFVTSPVDGSVTGFTPGGHTATLKEGDPDIKSLYEATKQATIDQKSSIVGKNAADLGLIAAQTASAQANAGLANTRAAQGGFAPSRTAPKDPKAIPMNQWNAAVLAQAKLGAPDVFSGGMSNIDSMTGGVQKKAAIAAAEKALRDKGYHTAGEGGGLLGSPATNGNAFGNLIPQAGTADSDSEDDEQPEDPNDL